MLIVDTRILNSQIPRVNLLRKKTANYILFIFSLITGRSRGIGFHAGYVINEVTCIQVIH